MRDTIEMAREAGLAPPDGPFITWGASDKQLKAFEALVRADEREACAKFCETHAVWVGRGKRGFFEYSEEEFATGGIHQGMDYASAIRARSQA